LTFVWNCVKLQSELREECPPSIMTRFREEHYATRSHKAFARGKVGKAGAPSPDTRASRKEYFKKSLPQREAIARATQRRLNGF